MQVVRLKHAKRYRVGGRVYWYRWVTEERLPVGEAGKEAAQERESQGLS